MAALTSLYLVLDSQLEHDAHVMERKRLDGNVRAACASPLWTCMLTMSMLLCCSPNCRLCNLAVRVIGIVKGDSSLACLFLMLIQSTAQRFALHVHDKPDEAPARASPLQACNMRNTAVQQPYTETA